MPYDEDEYKKGLESIISNSTKPKSDRERKQKDFTASQVAGMQSELTKANRKLRSGIFNTKQYQEERNRIFKKYDITKAERERFLGRKFATWRSYYSRYNTGVCQFYRVTNL